MGRVIKVNFGDGDEDLISMKAAGIMVEVRTDTRVTSLTRWELMDAVSMDGKREMEIIM